MQSRIRVLVKKCYFLIDVDEQHHGFSTLRYAIKICNEGMQQRYAIKIGSKKKQWGTATKVCNDHMSDSMSSWQGGDRLKQVI